MRIPGNFLHSVYFWLNNPDNKKDRKDFLKSLFRFIEHSEHITAYHVAPPANTPREIVNNTYTFNLVATFETKELQDMYQNERLHKIFISESEHLWKEVRIFDSFYDPVEMNN